MLDSGAGISLIPKDLFNAVNAIQGVELLPPDRRIPNCNGGRIKCYGRAYLTCKIHHRSVTHRFFVCENTVTVLLGRDMIRRADIVMKLATNEAFIDGKTIETYDGDGHRINNRVSLLRTYTLRPGEEVQLPTAINGKTNPDTRICVLEPARRVFLKTGALVARACVKPKNGKCPV